MSCSLADDAVLAAMHKGGSPKGNRVQHGLNRPTPQPKDWFIAGPRRTKLISDSLTLKEQEVPDSWPMLVLFIFTSFFQQVFVDQNWRVKSERTLSGVIRSSITEAYDDRVWRAFSRYLLQMKPRIIRRLEREASAFPASLRAIIPHKKSS